jgi:diketogulonate reductase-like aldo/keto reductase
MRENIDVFDFELTDDGMRLLDGHHAALNQPTENDLR